MLIKLTSKIQTTNVQNSTEVVFYFHPISKSSNKYQTYIRINLLTNTNIRSILIISGTQEDLPDHTNGVGAPLNQISLLSHIHTNP